MLIQRSRGVPLDAWDVAMLPSVSELREVRIRSSWLEGRARGDATHAQGESPTSRCHNSFTLSSGSAIEVPGTADLNAGGYASVSSFSCPSAGECATRRPRFRGSIAFLFNGRHAW